MMNVWHHPPHPKLAVLALVIILWVIYGGCDVGLSYRPISVPWNKLTPVIRLRLLVTTRERSNSCTSIIPSVHPHFVSTQLEATRRTSNSNSNNNKKGFGTMSNSASSPSSYRNNSNSKKQKTKDRSTATTVLNDNNDSEDTTTTRGRKSETTTASTNLQQSTHQQQQQLIEHLQQLASQSCLGQALAFAKQQLVQQKGHIGNNNNDNKNNGGELDPFWEFMPSLLLSRFPHVLDSDLQRIAGLLRHSLCPTLPKPDEEDDQCCSDPELRPLEDIHAYMPGLGPTKPFYDPSSLEICRKLAENYDVIVQEYHALLQEMDRSGNDRFQSVTSMNYDSGWKTVVLFYNGHRIEGFPYHVCPTTTKLLESLPLAGRIAGFNRQQPQSGIPRHTDGNNMWLTCQMGLLVPGEWPEPQPADGQNLRRLNHDPQHNTQRAYITVGNETRHWQTGQCLLYDTTYWHETCNPHPTQERVVLHVDFFNTLALTPVEVEVLQYIYSLREQFMKAEGVDKVTAQML